MMFQATERSLALPLPLPVITAKGTVGNHAVTPSRRQPSLLFFFQTLHGSSIYILYLSCHNLLVNQLYYITDRILPCKGNTSESGRETPTTLGNRSHASKYYTSFYRFLALVTLNKVVKEGKPFYFNNSSLNQKITVLCNGSAMP